MPGWMADQINHLYPIRNKTLRDHRHHGHTEWMNFKLLKLKRLACSNRFQFGRLGNSAG